MLIDSPSALALVLTSIVTAWSFLHSLSKHLLQNGVASGFSGVYVDSRIRFETIADLSESHNFLERISLLEKLQYVLHAKVISRHSSLSHIN